MVFQGEFNNSIDPKGRASIPARFREILKGTFGDERLVVTKRRDALVAYPLPEWNAILERVQDMRGGTVKDDILRTRVAPAAECSFDRQGRIQLPQSLRTYAALEKEVVVVGMFNKIEIWSQLRHAEETRASEDRLNTAQEVLAETGF